MIALASISLICFSKTDTYLGLYLGLDNDTILIYSLVRIIIMKKGWDIVGNTDVQQRVDSLVVCECRDLTPLSRLASVAGVLKCGSN